MAWSVGRATWVGDLSDADISQQVGSRTFDRGRAYFEQDRVRSLAARPEGSMLLATVAGSGEETYQTFVESRPHPRGRSPLWSGRCSCPVGADCKHVVALLLTARDVARGLRTGPAGDGGATGAAALHPVPVDAPRRQEVHWSEVLGHVRERAGEPAPVQRPEPSGDLMPAGLFVDTIYRSRGWSREPGLSYGLRATRWTKRGAWHRSLTWHDALPQWRGGMRYLPEHERVMSRIRDAARKGSGSTTYFTDAVPLSLDASPDIWPLLAEAQDVGIELLPGEGVIGPVVLADEAARLVLHVLRADDDSGDLLLRVVSSGLPEDTAGELVHLGDPVHGVAVAGDDGSLTLVPLVQDLGLNRDALMQALVGLRVPADERAGFLRSAMPGLRERVRVRSQVPLPVPDGEDAAAEGGRAERVTVHVRVVGDVPGEVRLEQAFAYGGRVRVFAAERFGGAVRDRTAEAETLEAAESLRAVPGAVWRDNGGFLHLTGRVDLRGVDAARFVTEHLPELEADEHVTVVVDGELPAYEEVTSAPVIRLGVGAEGERGAGAAEPGEPGEPGEPTGDGPTDWFDLRISVEVDGEEVPIGPLLTALATDQPVMLLESGAWFRLDRPELLRLKALVEEAREIADPESGALRLSRYHADLWEELVALGVVDEQSARWVAGIEALRDAADGPRPEAPAALRATLRPYQLDGYHWLTRLWDARLGGILADDMGLGKTLQVIAALTRAHERGELSARAPVLVVAPTSVVGTWLAEFETFAPHVPVTVVGATARKRGTSLTEAAADAAVVVTSYAVLRLDDAAFHGVPWSGVVLDEAQFVKNRQAKTHIAVRRLGAPFTLAVTGTPLENSLMDLWSLLSLTAPGLYPRPDVFTKNYRKPIESGERPELLDHLRRRIRPLMLRRTKEQVALDLPPKQVQVLPVEAHPVHRHIYDQHLQRERQRVLGLLADPDANRVAILAALTRLRQLALDPALVDEAHAGKATAAKVELLVDHLKELAAEGHRALVFSQFTSFLRIVERALDEAGLRTCYLDGATTNRQQVIRSFRDGQAAAFLISLKAGGFGLTLTEADYVFVLDPWWNPAAEAQAIDRAHRIGQTRPVTVYRLVSAGTIEEKVVALQERKRDLFQRVVDEGGALSGAITADDVKDLLDLG